MRVLAIANLCSAASTAMVMLAMPLFLVARGISLLQVGALFSAVAIGAIAVEYAAGRTRLFGRIEVVVGLLLSSALVLPLYLYVTTTAQFVALMAWASAAGAAAGPGLQALVAGAADPRERARAFANINATWSYAYAAGLVVGGLLLGVGFAAVFLAASGMLLLSSAATFFIVLRSGLRPRVPVAPAHRATWDALQAHQRRLADWALELRAKKTALQRRLPEGRSTWSAAWLMPAHMFLFDLSLTAYPVYFPLHLRVHGLPLAWVGLVVAASWIMFGFAQPIGARYADKTGRYRAVIVASLLVAAALNAIMAWSSLPWIIVTWLLLGLADGMGRPVAQTLVARHAAGLGLTRAFSRAGIAGRLARLAGPLFVGAIIASSTLPWGLTAMSLLLALSLVPIVLIRDHPAPAPSPPASQGETV